MSQYLMLALQLRHFGMPFALINFERPQAQSVPFLDALHGNVASNDPTAANE